MNSLFSTHQLPDPMRSECISEPLEGQRAEPSPSRKGKNFHALLIGIDRYKNKIENQSIDLAGCEADVKDWSDFLRNILGVSSDQIVTLCNEDATRAKIITGLQHLTGDEKIEPGDPILIFFAGHGATAPVPDGWHAGRPKIQMLLPYDFDSTGRDGPGLHDYTFNILLRNIADEKGNNIVCPQRHIILMF
jgi:hypothetical protein